MAGKLDQSLDDIVKDRRTTNRRVVRGRRVAKPVTKVAGPTGGVTKKTKNVKIPRAGKGATTAVVAANTPVVPARGESKIVVTGLPADVTENQIKEYFTKTIGPVKRAMLTYGPNGQSRGVVTIIFNKPNSAVEAATQLNGVKVDNRAMKIEVIVGANQAPVSVPAKALGDRIAQPKAQPKAANTKATAKPATKSAAKNTAEKKGRNQPKRTRNAGNAGRGKPKTAEQLDAEMTDYFGDGTATNGVNGQENVATSGAGAGMEDEVM